MATIGRNTLAHLIQHLTREQGAWSSLITTVSPEWRGIVAGLANEAGDLRRELEPLAEDGGLAAAGESGRD